MIIKFPNLRFPGFDGEWEVKKLGDVASKIGDGLHGTPIYIEDSDYYFINGNNLVNGKIEIYGNTKKVALDTFLKNNKDLKENTIFISINGTIGNIAKYNNEKVMLGKSVGYFNFDNNSDFIYFSLRTKSIQDYFISELTGSTIKNLSLKTLRETNISFPSLLEQQKISSLLLLIDERISHSMKIIEDLQALKSSLTQNFFKQSIRFKNDIGEYFPDWASKKLKDVLVKYEKKTTCNNQYPILTSARTGIYFQKDYFDNNEVASRDNTGYNIVPKGYFTYRHMSDDTIFKFNINSICENGIVSTLYPVFTTKYVNNLFLQKYLNEGKNFKNYSLLQKQGGSRTYMYFNKLIQLELLFPTIEEQNKIVLFLSSFNDKIDLEKNLLNRYQNQKKYLLNNLFIS